MPKVIWLGRNAFEAGLIQGLAGKPLPWTRPAWYNYNGNKLPALPRWDTEAYPYALMLCIEPEKMKYGILYLMSGPVKVVGDQLIAQEDINLLAFHNQTTYTTVDGGLNYWRPVESWSKAEGELVSYFASTAIWSNFDLYAQGSVTSYLYNGVELPALPDYDQESYPYACIQKSGTWYGFYASQSPIYVATTEKYGDAVYYPYPIYSNMKTDANAWGELGNRTFVVDQLLSGVELVWCNIDIEKNGSVYFTASDPVPVGGEDMLHLAGSKPTPWDAAEDGSTEDTGTDDSSTTEDTSTDSSGTTEGGTTGDSGSTDSTDQDNEFPLTPVE